MSGPFNKGIGAIDGITEMMHHIPLTAYWGQPGKDRLLESQDNIILFNALCIDGLVQERHNSITNALEFRLFSTNPFIWTCMGKS